MAKRKRLRNLTVEMVAICDRPANPGARVTLYKRDPSITPKAGRSISSQNLTHIVTAITHLQQILEQCYHTEMRKGSTSSHTGLLAAVSQLTSSSPVDLTNSSPMQLAEFLVAQSLTESLSPTNSLQFTKGIRQEARMEILKSLTEQFGKLADLSGDEFTAALTEVTKSLEALPGVIDEALITAKEAGATELATALKELAPEPKPDEIDKSELPEAVRKQLEDVEKRAKEAEEAIAKMQEEQEIRESVVKAAAYPHVAPAAELGPVLRTIAKADSDTHAKVTQWMAAANAKIAEGNLYSEIGKSGGTADVDARVESAAKEVQKADPSLSYEQAVTKALEMNPSLFTDSLT